VRRTIKILAVAALVAVMLVASISPALALKVRGGVLLKTEKPCERNLLVAQNDDGSQLQTGVVGRAPGCWVLTPGAA